VVVAEGVGATWFATGLFSVSPDGVLAYRSQAGAGGGTSQLTWIDRQGKPLSTVGPPGADRGISLSPDGSRAAVRDAAWGVTGDLSTLDLSSGRRTRLTFRKDNYSPGIWSPDGSRIAYAGGNLGETIYEKASSGVGDEKELLNEPGLRHYPTSWSADGRFLLYDIENAPETGFDLWVLPLEGDRKPVRLLGETHNEWAAVFSPDMRWIAYASLESGGNEVQVYVRPFRISETGTPSLGESKWQVSREFGNYPLWRNPQEIIFGTMPLNNAFFAVRVEANTTAFESGVPEPLFALPNNSLAMTADGQRFLLAAPTGQSSAPPQISVVLNWPTLMRK
jgi:Tol biopolymer transport system component